MMKTEFKEKDNGYEVAIDLPGFKKDELHLELNDGYLTISAEKGLQGQDTVFVFRMDIFLFHVLTNIKASAHAACITFTSVGRFFYLDAISLQIGFPLEENFSSYSVMTLPSFKTASWCRSYQWFYAIDTGHSIYPSIAM